MSLAGCDRTDGVVLGGTLAPLKAAVEPVCGHSMTMCLPHPCPPPPRREPGGQQSGGPPCASGALSPPTLHFRLSWGDWHALKFTFAWNPRMPGSLEMWSVQM